jgi:UDP-N-acetylmuramyl tripeptide synthase
MTRSDWLKEALVIPLPEDDALVLDGCRRLLGPNLYHPHPGAVGDALCPGFEVAAVQHLWVVQVQRLLDGLDWTGVAIVERPFEGGVSLFIPAPVDRLFTAAYVIEAAWYFCAKALLGDEAMPIEAMLADLQKIAAREANPALCARVAEAEARRLDRLLDDDAVTFGHGTGAVTWETESLPDAPDWAGVHDIPLALVTGTNGKTTTTRLIAAMARAAGLVSGLSSTEFVKVGDTVLDKGDYSGPAGARLLLRDPRLELGVLEVARGGILRRGLPVGHARVAVVTNVAADHLGQYGINTVAELAGVKLSVYRALAPGGQLVLNADDARVVAAAPEDAHQVWFSLNPQHPKILAARSAERPCGWFEEGWLMLSDGGVTTRLIAAQEVPLTLGGAARYNIENALAAALAARAMGLPDAAICATLAAFRSDAADNPGRANEFSVNGARVFVDFAHNPHSISAITSALAALPAAKRFVLLSHAGDRSDEDIRGLVSGAFALRPDLVVLAENPKYLRGRALGEVPDLMRQRCLELGMAPEQMLAADRPAEAAEMILNRVGHGDLALLLVHDDRDKIFAMLQAQGQAV